MNDDDIARRSGLWLWARRVLLALLLTVAVAVGRHLYLREKYRRDLEAAAAEMGRTHPGWRLDELEAARLPVADAANGATFVQACAPLLPEELPPLAGKAPPPVRNQRLPEPQAKQVSDALADLQPALLGARKLAGRDTGRFPIRYSRDALGTLLPHVGAVQKVEALLAADAALRGQRGDTYGAIVSCRALVNAGRSIGDEPLAISQIVRLTLVVNGCEWTEWVLGQGEAPEAELAALQAVLEKENRFPLLLTAARGECAAHHQFLDAVEANEVQKKSEGWFDFMARDFIRRDHPAIFPVWRRQFTIAQLPPHERADAEKEWVAEVLEVPKTVRPFFASMHKVEQSDRDRLAAVRCAVVALAAERYRLRHKAWPATLDDLRALVPADALVDPNHGKPLIYDRLPDGVLVYSVALDGPGEGPREPRPDLPLDAGRAFRLWDVKERGKPAPPAPPPEDEPGPPGPPPGVGPP